MRRHLLVLAVSVIVLSSATLAHACAGGTPKPGALSVSNCPNPFNPWTTVTYALPSPGNVTVAVYNSRGTRVITLVNEGKNAGVHSVEWDGRTSAGTPVRSGVYFLRIEHLGVVRTANMVVLK